MYAWLSAAETRQPIVILKLNLTKLFVLISFVHEMLVLQYQIDVLQATLGTGRQANDSAFRLQHYNIIILLRSYPAFCKKVIMLLNDEYIYQNISATYVWQNSGRLYRYTIFDPVLSYVQCSLITFQWE